MTTLKSVVLERVGDTIQFNSDFLAFANHYRFEPRPVAIRRGNEKGRVERHIDFVRKSFFAAREFADVDDLNAQAIDWCEGHALDRPWPQDDSLTVRQACALEQPRLLALPAAGFALGQRLDVTVAKTPYVRFDWNDYTACLIPMSSAPCRFLPMSSAGGSSTASPNSPITGAASIAAK